MLQGKVIAVVMPAYHAAHTLEKTVADIPKGFIDHVIVVDDCSTDETFAIAQKLGLEAYRNESNQNYGGNVKRCLQYGLDAGADIVIQIHPDAQYPPQIAVAMAALLNAGHYDLCLATRLGGRRDLNSAMPIWRLLSNRILTKTMDLCLGTRHTEYHTGYRGYTRKLLEKVPFHTFSNGFIFDNEVLAAALKQGFATCEVSCPTLYEEKSSSISFRKALQYGVECTMLSLRHLLWRLRRRRFVQTSEQFGRTGP
jgi:glycosyltransferase involved in cell wall biosynthesis